MDKGKGNFPDMCIGINRHIGPFKIVSGDLNRHPRWLPWADIVLTCIVEPYGIWIIKRRCIQHADILKRAYLCQVSDTGSLEPLVFLLDLGTVLTVCYFMPPRRRVGGHINLPLSVRSSVLPSRYRYMVCPAISSYSFGATALIFCRMFIHIMELCMSTGFWFSSNILKMTVSWT